MQLKGKIKREINLENLPKYIQPKMTNKNSKDKLGLF